MSNNQMIMGNGWQHAECMLSDSAYEVTLKNGMRAVVRGEMKCEVMMMEKRVKSMRDVKVKDLKVGDKVKIFDGSKMENFGEIYNTEYAYMAGLCIGDGSVFNERGRMYARLAFWNDDIDIFNEEIHVMLIRMGDESGYTSSNQHLRTPKESKIKNNFDYEVVYHKSAVLGRLLAEDGLSVGNKHIVPKSIWSSNKETIDAFIRGLMSADGGAFFDKYKQSCSVRIIQIHKNLLYELQLLLLQFGINSIVAPRHAAERRMMNDGKGGMKLYDGKECYELRISKRSNIERFVNFIGFKQDRKNNILEDYLNSSPGSNNSNEPYIVEIGNILPLNGATICVDIQSPTYLNGILLKT